MSKIARHNSTRHAHIALRMRTADANQDRVSTIANSMAAKRNIREEQLLMASELAEAERLKITHGVEEKLVTPELAYLYSIGNYGSRDLSDGGTMLAKQKLTPATENLRHAQDETCSSNDRRGQLIDILV